MSQATLFKQEIGNSLRRVVENTERDSKLVQGIIDASGSSIVIIDETRSIVFANRAWRQFATRSGVLSGESGLGKTYPELSSGIASASPRDAVTLKDGIRQIIDGEEIEFEMRYRCTAVADPTWIAVHASSFARSEYDGGRLILITHDDVSSSELASAEVRKDEIRFRRLLETTNIVPWERSSGEAQFTYVGEQALDLLGYSIDEWKQNDFWSKHIHPDDRSRIVAQYSNISPFTEHFKCEYRMISEDGRMIWIEDLVDVDREWGRRPTMHGFMTNITDRKQAESALADVTRRLIDAQEVERRRIARELHDDINQRVALISIELEQAAQMCGRDPSRLADRLRSLQQKASEISNEIHRMSYELHPSKLEHLGLVSALRSFCSELARSRGIKIEFHSGKIPETLDRDITLCVFRTAQEAMQNASKHSGADEIVVNLDTTQTKLELSISDEGRGFSPTQKKMTEGLGLTSMQERVRHTGGSFNVTSAPGHGTTIHVTIPIAS
jgi:PAS domain S-box-containing protein